MKDMETIEEIYASMLEEHELVLAARRQERIKAANPYGCNQYGEGWKAPHNGKQSKAGEPAKKDSGEVEKKEPEKPEPQKEEDEDNSWSDERSHDYKELRHDIEEVVHKSFARMARGYPVTGIYFDGENFHLDNQDGRATLLYTGDDIDDFLEENDMQESTVDDQTERFMQNRGRDVFDEIDWDEAEETKKHYDKWKR